MQNLQLGNFLKIHVHTSNYQILLLTLTWFEDVIIHQTQSVPLDARAEIILEVGRPKKKEK